ncbi:SH3 domain-containing protein [Plectonema radiosum NIES-515]|uniref:SH3 domain-containing protein n=1 Tax=Plectonema radiosum NIES-515 TaxID=2986073 RepID=A0ABT3AZT8_9CYAN|nr:SH3 domain-containing protein [Plectonema radiosum]MCV3214104.1 SH3 domain-containing protein [Plectonema radiosum NIES-515]
MMVSNVLKYILGIFLAIVVLIGGGVATALYFMNRTAVPPTKPIFANDSPEIKAQAPKTPGASPALTPTPFEARTTKPNVTPTLSPDTTESKKPLPAGAYNARVSWSQGLSLRAEAKQDAEKVGGVGFNQKIIVLEESQDKVWQKIRLEDSDQEGWVKAGNTKKVDAQDNSQPTQQ